MKKLKEITELQTLDAAARKRQESDEVATVAIEAQVDEHRAAIAAAQEKREADRAQRAKARTEA